MQRRSVIRSLLIMVLLGGGFALAALGRRRRAFAYQLALVPIALLSAFVTPWALLGALVLALAQWTDTFLLAYRGGTRFRLATPWPWLVWVTSVAIALALRGFVVEPFRISSSGGAPTIVAGDHVLVEKLSLRWRAPGRGELIVYRYPCDPRLDYLKRVVAVGGDTVEIRCSVLYVNGKATSEQLVEDRSRCSYEDRFDGRLETRPCSRYHEALDGRGYDVFDDPDRPERDAHSPATGDLRDFPEPGMPPPSCAQAPPEAGPPNLEVHQVAGKLVVTVPPERATACEPQEHFVVPEGAVFVLGDNRFNSNDSRIYGSVPLANVKGRVTGIWWSRHVSRIGRVR